MCETILSRSACVAVDVIVIAHVPTPTRRIDHVGILTFGHGLYLLSESWIKFLRRRKIARHIWNKSERCVTYK